MDYERIDYDKPTGIISPRLSPQKLRLKLIGVQKGWKSSETQPSMPNGLDKSESIKDSLLTSGSGSSEDISCIEDPQSDRKNSSAVQDTSNTSVNSKVSTYDEVPNLGVAMQNVAGPTDLNWKENRSIQSRHQNLARAVNTQMEYASKSCEDDTYEYDSGHENCSVSSFEFHKAERVHQRRVLGTNSKPAPSKWDDAEKWLVNQNKSKAGFAMHQGMPVANLPKKMYNPAQGRPPRNIPNGSGLGLQSPLDARQGVEMHKFYADKSMANPLEVASSKFAFVPTAVQSNLRILSSFDRYPLEDMSNSDLGKAQSADGDTFLRSTLRIEKPLADPSFNGGKCDASAQHHMPTSSVMSVSMRDMGTEMTPIASQEPSRTGTPVKATTPNARSPVSSRPSTPGRAAPASSPTYVTDNESEPRVRTKELSEKEMHAKTRQEIIALGAKLGKANIAAWARKREEEEMASKTTEEKDSSPSIADVSEARAIAWEEAEKAKYMAKHKREEIKIQSWESQQKAKAEVEIRRIEVKAERIRNHAHEKLMNKLAAIQHKAEVKRAAAEAKRSQQAAKTSQRADYIRRTGHIPSPFFCFCC